MENKEKIKGLLKVSGTVLIVIGLFLSTMALSNYIRFNNLIEDGGAVNVKADVVKYEEEYVRIRRNGKTRRRKVCETELHYDVDGTTQIYMDNLCHSEIGNLSKVDIHYLTEEPDEIFFASDINGMEIFQNLLILIGGTVAVIIGVKMSPY